MTRERPLSLHPLDPEKAIAAFLAVKPPPKAPSAKKKPAKAKRRAKAKKKS
jgi:hypothetical protein